MTVGTLNLDDGSAKELSGDWVEIYHPGIDGTHVCLREAFEQVWQAKGWELTKELHSSTEAETDPDAVAAHDKVVDKVVESAADKIEADAAKRGIDETVTVIADQEPPDEPKSRSTRR